LWLKEGPVTVVVIVAMQLLESVTVITYVPAGKPVNIEPFWLGPLFNEYL
jgi:hypothetical protein